MAASNLLQNILKTLKHSCREYVFLSNTKNLMYLASRPLISSIPFFAVSQKSSASWGNIYLTCLLSWKIWVFQTVISNNSRIFEVASLLDVYTIDFKQVFSRHRSRSVNKNACETFMTPENLSIVALSSFFILPLMSSRTFFNSLSSFSFSALSILNKYKKSVSWKQVTKHSGRLWLKI